VPVTLQLYFGPDGSYAVLPHNPQTQNVAINVISKSGVNLSLSITVSNSGPEEPQVCVKFYSKVTNLAMIADAAHVDNQALAAIAHPTQPVKHWDNLIVSAMSTWCSGPFPYTLAGVGTAYVLVATLSCPPLNEFPSSPHPTQDPCDAIWAAPL
jgi:hypothetical protein